MPLLSSAARVAALLAIPAAACAQPAAADAPAPRASEPYRSAFDGYRRHADQPVAPWRESNDTVARIGGWRAYAREAQDVPPQRPAR